MAEDTRDVSGDFEKAARKAEASQYVLRLYVAGINKKSSQAIATIQKICEEHLNNKYELEVIDTYQHPDLAKRDQIVALPTLIKELPSPLQRIIGDLSSTQKVLVGLNLIAKEEGRADEQV